MKARKAAVWTGVVEAVGEIDCEILDHDRGAFIRIFTWVSSRDEFERRVHELMSHDKLRMISTEDIETVQPGKNYGEGPGRFSELLEQTIETKGVIMGTFHTYPLHDGRKT